MRYRWLFILLSCFIVTCSHRIQTLPGYIEAEYTYVATPVSGRLFELLVQRGQSVKKGQILFKLDPNPEQDQVNSAEANIKEVNAQITLANVTLQRQKTLVSKNFSTKEALDTAQSNLAALQHKLASLQAQSSASKWNLAQKTVYSLVDGFVFDTFFNVGEQVQAEQPVLALLTADRIRVLFYVPEQRLSQIHIGQTITFICDGCKATNAVIHYISPSAEYTPPVIYSKDSRDKLIYLIRAKIPEDIAFNFHPGQPIDVQL